MTTELNGKGVKLKTAAYIRYMDELDEEMATRVGFTQSGLLNWCNDEHMTSSRELVFVDDHCFRHTHPSQLPALNKLVQAIRTEEIDQVALFGVSHRRSMSLILVVDVPTKNNLLHKGMKYFIDKNSPSLIEELATVMEMKDGLFDQEVWGKQQRAILYVHEPAVDFYDNE